MRGTMKTSRVAVILGTFFVLASTKGVAQYPEDALRLSLSNISVGARALGMGGAYTGIANDFSAIYWNPAGLGQLRQFELSGGIGHLGYNNDATFLGQSSNYTNSSTSINTAGLVYPIPTRRGSFTLAFGYNRSVDFTTALAFDGFNPYSSIVQGEAPDGEIYPSDLSGNLPYQLYLANIDTVTGRFVSPIRDSVAQSGRVLEGGGVNNWSLAGALEIAPGFFLGGTLTLISGSYSYTRNYIEGDSKRIYQTFPFNFQQLTLDDAIDWDLSGYGLKVGMLYRIQKLGSVGVTVKIPTSYTVKEGFSTNGNSLFDDGDNFSYETNGRSEYDVATPFVFAGGLTYNVGGLLLSGDAEYTDWSQMEFKNPSSNVADILRQRNLDIKDLFGSTINLRGGAECAIPGTDVSLRGGFAYNPSPYKDDPSSFAQKYVTGGIAFAVESSVFIDVAYSHGWWNTYHVNYQNYPGDQSSRTDESIKTNNLLFGISYRF
jgi:long-subunit fatty acid transport protein